MLKNIQKFLKLRRKWIFTILIFTIIFFVIRLPWTEMTDKIVRQVTEPLPVNVHFKKTFLHIFPPGLSLNQVSLSHRILAEPVSVDRIRIHPAYSEWLAFSKGATVHFIKEGTRFSLVFFS